MKHRLLFLMITLLLLVTHAPSNAQQSISHSHLAYISPRPGARLVHPQTSIAIREGSALDPGSASAELFTVVGSRSGVHSGRVKLSDDQRTLLFYPDSPFAYRETISVEIRPGLLTAAGDQIAGERFQFSTLAGPPRPVSLDKQADPVSVEQPQSPTSQPGPSYVTHPELSHSMPVSVTVPAQNTADGYMFVAGRGLIYDSTLLITDNTGEPIYIQSFPDNAFASDFKRQDSNGETFMVYHRGIRRFGYTSGSYYVMDQAYNTVDIWTISNGWGADLHEFLLLDNGHTLMLSYVEIPYDLSPYGGPADGYIMDIIIQEQDTQHNVVFEWRGTEHIPLTDTYVPLTTRLVDYIHTNAIEVDHDGNLMISSRSLSEITKIDRNTGEIIWRLGGKQNEFNFVNDDGFYFQHDIRRLPNGRITLFDNRTTAETPQTRAVEYEIDEESKVITKTWQYPNDESVSSPYMGNAQRLPNGNTLIGWGSHPYATEVMTDGTKTFELYFNGESSYRSFRFPWKGLPAHLPRLVAVTSTDPTTATLFMSWNGATDIDSYEIYGGTDAENLLLLDEVPRTGFETSTTLTGLSPDICVFQIRPIHREGEPTLFSASAYRMERPECTVFLTQKMLLPALYH